MRDWSLTHLGFCDSIANILLATYSISPDLYDLQLKLSQDQTESKFADLGNEQHSTSQYLANHEILERKMVEIKYLSKDILKKADGSGELCLYRLGKIEERAMSS